MSQHDFSTLDKFIDSINMPILDENPLDYAIKHLQREANQNRQEEIILEFGVCSGYTINKIAANFPNKQIYGFDSFEGLPEDWVGCYTKGAFHTYGQIPWVPDNVILEKGWFNETLPKFRDRIGNKKASFVHIDCDLYSSTKTIFDVLGDSVIGPGTYLVFDELFHYQEYKMHEIKAFYEYLVRSQLDVEWLGVKDVLLKNYDVDPSVMGLLQNCACVLRALPRAKKIL